MHIMAIQLPHKHPHNWKRIMSIMRIMIPRMIRSKASVPHDIIRAEMGVAPIITEALFQSVTCTQRLWELPKQRYPRLALMSSRQLAENGDIHIKHKLKTFGSHFWKVSSSNCLSLYLFHHSSTVASKEPILGWILSIPQPYRYHS